MLIPFLISKIHRVTVTETDMNLSGSISIDSNLMKEASLREFQKVEIYNISNGNRLSTYVMKGEEGSRDVILNGTAAHFVSKGDEIVITAYALLDERELNSLNSVILLMKENNEIDKIISGGL